MILIHDLRTHNISTPNIVIFAGLCSCCSVCPVGRKREWFPVDEAIKVLQSNKPVHAEYLRRLSVSVSRTSPSSLTPLFSAPASAAHTHINTPLWPSQHLLGTFFRGSNQSGVGFPVNNALTISLWSRLLIGCSCCNGVIIIDQHYKPVTQKCASSIPPSLSPAELGMLGLWRGEVSLTSESDLSEFSP